MNGYISYVEVQSVVGEKIRGGRREPAKLTLGDGRKLRRIAQYVFSLIF